MSIKYINVLLNSSVSYLQTMIKHYFFTNFSHKLWTSFKISRRMDRFPARFNKLRTSFIWVNVFIVPVTILGFSIVVIQTIRKTADLILCFIVNNFSVMILIASSSINIIRYNSINLSSNSSNTSKCSSSDF